MVFSHLDVISGVITMPASLPAPAIVLIRQLYTEASIGVLEREPLPGPGRSLDELERMVLAVRRIASKRAMEWAIPGLRAVIEGAAGKDGVELDVGKVLGRIESAEPESGEMSFGIASLAVSPAGPDILYHALNNDPWPESAAGLDAGEMMATYGLVFMDNYAEEVVHPRPESQETREICLQLAGLCLHIAGVFRVGNDLESEREESTKQKVTAGKRRSEIYYVPLRNKAIELYSNGGPWKSTRAASLAIVGQVLEFAKGHGLYLSPDRAQVTVYEWLLEHLRNR